MVILRSATGFSRQSNDMNSPKKHRYHHGNLKEELLIAALKALEAESMEKLSLRGLAKTLGVTPTAVYSHFADKTELLIELRTRGFRQLSEAMRDAADAVPTGLGTEDRVRCYGRAYMRFAVGHPNLFDIMFSWTPDLARITPECAEEGCCGEAMLRLALTELLREQGHEMNDYQAALASFSTWSLVHGISTLLKSGSVEGAIHCEHWPVTFSAQNPQSQSQVLEHLLTIQIEGLKVAAARCEAI